MARVYRPPERSLGRNLFIVFHTHPSGVQLAEARQNSLANLARKQPSLANEQLLSLAELADLPEPIRAVSEQAVSGNGSIDLRWSNSGGDSDHHECRHHSVAFIGDKSWRVNGPDYIDAKPPRANVPISGHLIKGDLLVSTSPIRKVSGKDLAAARKLFPVANPDGIDPVTGNAIKPGQSTVAAIIGGQIYQFEKESTVDQVAAVVAEADQRADDEKTYTPQYPFSFLAALVGNGSAAQGTPVAATPFQVDNINVLFIRVDFSDKPGEPVSVTDLQTSLSITNTNLQNYSYSAASLISTVTTQLYRLPSPSTTYANSASGSSALMAATRTLAAADYALANYDVVAVSFTQLNGTDFGYAGQASVGGGSQWLNGQTYNTARANVMTHEFGHNYGLNHANYYHPAQQIGGDYSGPGFSSLEYGDIFDTMGFAYNSAIAYFNPYSTRRLSWMPSTKIQQVTNNGTWRIYRFDDPTATANPLLSLRVPLGGNEYWWVGLRQNYTGTANSAYVTAEGIVSNTPNLIDMTPTSFPSNGVSNRADAALPVLSNYYSPAKGVRIRNLASGGIAPNQWIDVSVEFDSQLQFATTSVEVDEQAGNAILTLKRAFNAIGVASVNYTTASGTATSGTDFLPVSGSVTWANGDLADQQIFVPIRPDAVADGAENFTVTLSGATGGALILSQSVATITIREAGQRFTGFTSNLFNTTVETIARLADGKILIGGTLNSGITGNIARLNTNGSVDSSFLKGIGFNGVVYHLLVQMDGKILCGGNFTSYDGAVCNRIARLNADGTLDSAFTSAIGAGANVAVYSIAIESTGKILIGGDFTTLNGTAALGVARLLATGVRDSANTLAVPFNSGFGVNVRDMLAQADGKIMVVGQFYGPNVGSNFRSGVARLNADGTRDTTFDPVAGLHAAGAITNLQSSEAIVRQPNGKYILSGNFSAYNTNAVSNIVRVNSDGSYDSSFVTPAFNNTVKTLLLQSSGALKVGGSYGSPANHFTRLLSTGASDPNFSPGTGPGGTVASLADDKDGSFWVGGNFFTYNGVSCVPIVKVAGGVSGYDLWITGQSFNRSQLLAGGTAAEADPDNDGISNIAEMALGSSPTVANANQPFAAQASSIGLVASGPGQYLQATFPRAGANPGVWLTAQFSSDLSAWLPSNPLSGTSATYDIVADTATGFTVRDQTPSSAAPARFLRFVAKKPE